MRKQIEELFDKNGDYFLLIDLRFGADGIYSTVEEAMETVKQYPESDFIILDSKGCFVVKI